MPKAKRTTLGKGWRSYHIGSEQSTKITSYIVAHGAYAKKHGTVTWTLPEFPLYFYTMHGHFMWIALEIYPVIGATQVKLPTSICGAVKCGSTSSRHLTKSKVRLPSHAWKTGIVRPANE